jgi:hypothetical protein
MLSENNSVQMIQSEFPSLAYQLKPDSSIKQLFRAVQNLADYTKEQLLENNQFEIEHCFRVAHEISNQGSNISRMAIENAFVYSVSRLLEKSFSVSQEARKLFLKFFGNEYCKQINASFP